MQASKDLSEIALMEVVAISPFLSVNDNPI
jgi:hypothetical protein